MGLKLKSIFKSRLRIVQTRRLRPLIFLIFSLTPVFGFSANEAAQTFTLDGVLYKKGTTSPLTDTNVTMKIQVINPAGTCLLYEEQQRVDTFASKGYFTVQVGSVDCGRKAGA